MTLEDEVRKIWNHPTVRYRPVDKEIISKVSKQTTELLKQRWAEALTSPMPFIRKHVEWMIKKKLFPKL